MEYFRASRQISVVTLALDFSVRETNSTFMFLYVDIVLNGKKACQYAKDMGLNHLIFLWS